MTYARDEAIRIVDWLLDGGLTADESIAVELPFLDVRRKADIAVVGPRRLSAIEIKGPRDNFHRLAPQLNDYQAMFLDVSIAVPTKHLASARALVPDSVGLILLSDDSVAWIRRPRVRSKLKPADAVNWLRSKDLNRVIDTQLARTVGLVSARELASKSYSAKELTRVVLDLLASRNRERYAAFQSEKGERVNLDDLQMLSLQAKVRA